jgi:hypothetical protein
VLGALRSHAAAAPVQQEGFNALGKFAEGSPERCAAIALAGGGAALLVGGMRAHAGHLGTQRWGCNLVINLATYGSAAVGDALVAAGAAAVVGDALAAHGGADPSFCQAACRALAQLARASPAGLAAVRAAGPLAVARPLVAAIPAGHTTGGVNWEERAKQTLAELEAALAE